MADQTVKIEGDSGSNARVALDLIKYVRSHATDRKDLSVDETIALYLRCLKATYGSKDA
jgi:hypothetical protein